MQADCISLQGVATNPIYFSPFALKRNYNRLECLFSQRNKIHTCNYLSNSAHSEHKAILEDCSSIKNSPPRGSIISTSSPFLLHSRTTIFYAQHVPRS